MSTSQALPNLSRHDNLEPPLLRLPQELLIRVASYVTTPELGNLRRSCKDVESRLFESFAHEFFHKRQFMIEEPSLQALVDISKHPTLSKRLTEVIISTTQYGEADNPASMTSQWLLLGGYTHHDILVSSGQAKDMLIEAFDNLPNLRKVGVRDYDGKGRDRDGQFALWRSYGHAFMEGELSQTYPPDQAWTLLLHAIASSTAQVPSVEVFLRHAWRLSDKSFDVLSSRASTTIAPALAQLTTLMLSLSTERAVAGRSNASRIRDLRLKKFLHHTPALERLRLNFDEGPTTFLDWLASSPGQPSNVGAPTNGALDGYAAPVTFANLTTLDIGMVRVEPSILLQAITRFPLKSFNLWRIFLLVGARSDIEAANANAAAQFVDSLASAQATTNVQYAMLGYLKVNAKDDPRHRAYGVDFPPSSPAKVSSDKRKDKKAGGASPRKLEHQTMSFRGGFGSNFAAWAKEMARRAVVVKQSRGYVIDTSDSDSDSESSDEVDEELGDDEDDV